jgi:hypothetical protein
VGDGDGVYNEKVLGGSRIMKEEGLQYLRRLEKQSVKNGEYL